MSEQFNSFESLVELKEVNVSRLPLISFSARGVLLHDQPPFEKWCEAYFSKDGKNMDEREIRRVLLKVLATFNESAQKEELANPSLLEFMKSFLQEMFGMSSEEASAQANKSIEIYRASVKMVIPEESFEVCETLKKRGYRLAIVSNEGKALVEILKMYRLFDYFDVILSREDFPEGKPSKEIFEALYEEFDLQPKQIAHIGDHFATDVVGAQRAGIHSVLYDPKNYEMLALNKLEDTSGKVVSLESLRSNRALTNVKVFTRLKDLLEFFK